MSKNDEGKTWNDLTLKEKSEMMKVAIANGYTNLHDIKQKYNEFAEGGSINDEADTSEGEDTTQTEKAGVGVPSYIGGTSEEARQAYWRQYPRMTSVTDSIAGIYGIDPTLLRNNLDREGFTDARIRENNRLNKEGKSVGKDYSDDILKRETYSEAMDEYGLDNVGYMIKEGKVVPVGNPSYDLQGNTNEKGQQVYTSEGYTHMDNINLSAAALKYLGTVVDNDYPTLSPQDRNRYIRAYYNRGIEGGRRWAKNGAKGYTFGDGGSIVKAANIYDGTSEDSNQMYFGRYLDGVTVTPSGNRTTTRDDWYNALYHQKVEEERQKEQQQMFALQEDIRKATNNAAPYVAGAMGIAALPALLPAVTTAIDAAGIYGSKALANPYVQAYFAGEGAVNMKDRLQNGTFGINGNGIWDRAGNAVGTMLDMAMLSPLTKMRVPKSFRGRKKTIEGPIIETAEAWSKWTDAQWNKAHAEAEASKDYKRGQELWDAWFAKKAPDNRLLTPERKPVDMVHTVAPRHNPSFNSFDPYIEGRETAVYTTDNRPMSASYLGDEAFPLPDEIVKTKSADEYDRLARYVEAEKNLLKDKPNYFRDPLSVEAYNEHVQQLEKQFAAMGSKEDYIAFQLEENAMKAKEAARRTKELYGYLGNPIEVKGMWSPWNKIPMKTGKTTSTRGIEEMVRRANKAGATYDGVIIHDIADWGSTAGMGDNLLKRYGTVFEFMNPAHLKYKDPFTYDDAGNLIPLTQRANFDMNDLRYAFEHGSSFKVTPEDYAWFDLEYIAKDALPKYAQHPSKGNLINAPQTLDERFNYRDWIERMEGRKITDKEFEELRRQYPSNQKIFNDVSKWEDSYVPREGGKNEVHIGKIGEQDPEIEGIITAHEKDHAYGVPKFTEKQIEDMFGQIWVSYLRDDNASEMFARLGQIANWYGIKNISKQPLTGDMLKYAAYNGNYFRDANMDNNMFDFFNVLKQNNSWDSAAKAFNKYGKALIPATTGATLINANDNGND